MDAILISFAICVLGVMVTVLLFAIAMRPEKEKEEAAPEPKAPYASESFFLEEATGVPAEPQAPTNALILDLEQHVRGEQKAAEVFVRGPNPDSLHAPTDSPLWH